MSIKFIGDLNSNKPAVFQADNAFCTQLQAQGKFKKVVTNFI